MNSSTLITRRYVEVSNVLKKNSDLYSDGIEDEFDDQSDEMS